MRGTTLADAVRITQRNYPLNTRVRKKRGAEWHGKVCGYYATDLTGEGVCVESEREIGSVQIYPIDALEIVP